MAWIASHQALERHPKVHYLMAVMGWDLDTAIGKLHRFWWWCLSYAETGDLRKWTDLHIAGGVGIMDEAIAQKFVRALENGRLIDLEPCRRVHDWWDYVGPYFRSKYRQTPRKWERVRDFYESGVLPDMTAATTGDMTTGRQEREIEREISERDREREEAPAHAGGTPLKGHPKPEEVTAYARSIGFKLEGQRFVDFYESRGWKVGKNPMKNWQAAVRNWKHMDAQRSAETGSRNGHAAPKEAKYAV